MLVAEHNGNRVEAEFADREHQHYCRNCRQAVILKKGRLVTAHFAHKPPVTCEWGKGETRAHLDAKRIVRDALASRGLKTELEYIIPALPGDRRADVFVWSPQGEEIAIELQHTPLLIPDIERRAFSYARLGITQLWIPFLRTALLSQAVQRRGGDRGDRFIERYPARPFERWVHGLHHGSIWFYASDDGVFWRGRFVGHERHVPLSEWRSETGEEMQAGGYKVYSKRWRELTLWGPYTATDLRIKTDKRPPYEAGPHKWPDCRVARFCATENRDSSKTTDVPAATRE